jgi:hypothetical protein
LWRTATAEIAANSGVPPWLNASASMASSGQIHSRGSNETGPATIAVTYRSGIERLVAAGCRSVRRPSHWSSSSSGMAAFAMDADGVRRRELMQQPAMNDEHGGGMEPL